ncbi:MAG: hypothetical protein RQ993_05625 [Bacteroidota bacterium]|nr:hypothetical protein [Bacteroidota bacterium]
MKREVLAAGPPAGWPPPEHRAAARRRRAAAPQNTTGSPSEALWIKSVLDQPPLLGNFMPPLLRLPMRERGFYAEEGRFFHGVGQTLGEG